jgi:hypothetical protein
MALHVNMATIHAVCPGNIIGKEGKYPFDVSGVEAVIDAFDHFDVIVRHIVPRLWLKDGLGGILGDARIGPTANLSRLSQIALS